ncbi:conjugal transfer protein TraH (plasmid) [Aminobacter sp. Y103A]|uniref:TraH family protein n=1 Tax=Aminobacter sp. Y103A TaxID=1870862 RepID=UPI002572EB22|nr:TraH family protein [Aminobacter sp. SS-2016]BBD41485.1 conjugal transfer protein TraH [Aminobacter sp. SS-2016]
MVDAAVIQQCAGPGLKPAIVERFIERVGSEDPLAITVRSGNRIVLVPKPTTPEETLALIRENLGRNMVRVGITQYPAGLGIMEAGELKPNLVDPCENIRMGTALFAKVYRTVMKWYGNPTEKDVLPQVLDDAIIAWQTGYFEGTAVFRAPDLDEVELAAPDEEKPEIDADEQSADAAGEEVSDPVKDGTSDDDPNKAGIRIDLSGIGAK